MNVTDQTVKKISDIAEEMVLHFNELYDRNDDASILLSSPSWLANILVSIPDRDLKMIMEELDPEYAATCSQMEVDLEEVVAQLLVRRFAQQA